MPVFLGGAPPRRLHTGLERTTMDGGEEKGGEPTPPELRSREPQRRPRSVPQADLAPV